MPDSDATIQPPPSGDPTLAEKYINRLTDLLNQDKVLASHTDLKKFDPSNLEDHYRIDLKDYQVEISHSKQASDGKDQYIILFTNIQNVRENSCEKIILAYMYLNEEQFRKFKLVAGDQIERKRKEEEERRLHQALVPVDNILEKISNGEEVESDTGRDDVLENVENVRLEENTSPEGEHRSSQVDSTNL